MHRESKISVGSICSLNFNEVMWKSTIGSFSNDDDDENKNVKKAIGSVIEANNKFARALHLFLHFFAVTARLRRENA